MEIPEQRRFQFIVRSVSNTVFNFVTMEYADNIFTEVEFSVEFEK